MKHTTSPSSPSRKIPRPFFHHPGAEHALVDVIPSPHLAEIQVQWMSTDPLRFTPDLIRAIDTVIRQSDLTESPDAAPHPPGCLRLLLSITYRAGIYEVEPALARLQGSDSALVTERIDRLVARLKSLLRYAGAGRARMLHGRN